MDNTTRIVNGAKYFKEMKPSDFTINGVVNPKTWYQLQALLDLILTNGGEQQKLTLDEQKEILK